MTAKKQKQAGYDFLVIVPTILLIGLGLVAIYSASSILAEHKLGDSYFYLQRQGLFCLIGLFLMITVKNIPVIFYSKVVYPLLFISLALLAALMIPGLGKTVNYSCRWISIAGFSIQPSELAKPVLAIYLAYSMSKKGPDMALFSKGLLPHMVIVGSFMCLILLQPDLGTTIILGSWLLILLFVGGMNLFHLMGIVIISIPILFWLIKIAAYRMKRLLVFINPWEDPLGDGFQILHSFMAFGSGGIFGVGLGNSKQKLMYLPESHTDFILSIIAEELGLLGIFVIIILFSILIIRGIKISLNARDLYSSYLALAISTLFGLQVLINMGVVMGLLPTTGLTLPLISYGGSSLIVNLIGIGMLLSIASNK